MNRKWELYYGRKNSIMMKIAPEILGNEGFLNGY